MDAWDVASASARIEALVSAGARRVAKPYVVMLTGLPGTGKSSLCRKLRHGLPVAVIESDSVRSELFPDSCFSPVESERVFNVCFQVMEGLLRRGLAVVLDATNLRERHREPVYEIADRCGAPLLIVQVDAHPEVVRERLERRAAAAGERRPFVADWEVYQRMVYARERIGRSYLYVDTTEGLEEAAARVTSAVETLTGQGKETGLWS